VEQFPVPLPSVPVGGRLTQFLHHWEKFTTDVWVLSVIRGGLDLVFQERPPLSDSPIPMSQTSDKEKFRGYGNKHPKGPVWWSTYLEEYKL
jgi:hypothetical protein